MRSETCLKRARKRDRNVVGNAVGSSRKHARKRARKRARTAVGKRSGNGRNRKSARNHKHDAGCYTDERARALDTNTRRRETKRTTERSGAHGLKTKTRKQRELKPELW